MPSILFSVLTFAVLPFWALLIFAPRSRYTRLLVHGAGIFLVLSGAYVGCIVVAGLSPLNGLEAAMHAFQDPWLFLAGWIHYLCFDLMVGAWVVRDAERHKLSQLLVAPVLLLVLNLGPLGLLVYLALRAALRRSWAMEA